MSRHPWDPPKAERRRQPPRAKGLRRFGRADPLLWCGVVGLVTLGVLNLAGLGDEALAQRQLLTSAFGVAVAIALARTRHGVWVGLGRLIYGTAVLLLVGVALAGSHANGAARWFDVGGLLFQPSELAKIGLLLVLADVLGKSSRRHRFLIALAAASVPIGLTLIEPDLSTTGLLVVITAAVVIQARIRLRSLVATAAAAVALAPMALHLLRPYQLSRLEQFLSGGSDALGAGWSVLQSHIAVASAGLLGNSSPIPYSLLAQYLPDRETDLALVSLVEQRGLLAGAAVLAATALVVWRLVALTKGARTQAAALVGGGLAVLLGAEVLISAAGGLGLIPLAGVPCPFISAGGSVAVAHLAAIGIVLGISQETSHRLLWVAPRRLRRRPRLVRLSAVGLSLALAGTGMAMLQLRIHSGPQLRSSVLAEVTRTVRVPAPRGMIVDRHGAPLAVESTGSGVLTIPSIVLSQQGEVTTLGRLLGTTEPALTRALLSPSSDGVSVTLPGTVPNAVAARIQAAKLPGVRVVASGGRSYPYGSLLGPLLGFVGMATPADVAVLGPLPPGEIVGRAGLEREYDQYLRGVDGEQRVLVDPNGLAVAMSSKTPPVPGVNLQLTIDLGLQQEATAALDTALEGVSGQPRGDQGAVVVMDATNGQVLAMASAPSYDDNIYGPPVNDQALSHALHAPGLPLLEHATQDAVPPGSTYKLVVAAADTVYKAVPPSTVVTTGATFTYDGATFHNWAALPPQNLVQSIAWSNDVYFYKLALGLGPARIAQIAGQLGVGRPTGIDLPGESSGVLGTPQSVTAQGGQWYPGSTVDLGIGQGYLTVTPLQDARWTAAVATGDLVTPRLGLAVTTPEGSLTLAPPAPQPLSFAADLGPVRQGLRLAVTEGTATMLQHLPQPAGGKTGTAQDTTTPGGAPDAWFTAVYPLTNPRVVVTAMVHGGGEGYNTAEPLVASLLHSFIARSAEILATTPLMAPPSPQATPGPAGGPAPPAAAPGAAPAAASTSRLRRPR